MYLVELHFSGSERVQLQRFVFHSNKLAIESVRGRTGKRCVGANCFNWTSGVRALSVLFLNAALDSYQKAGSNFTGHLVGSKGSLASSLNNSLCKQPEWLLDMFGVDKEGKSLLRRFLHIENASQKRPGPVAITLKSNFVSPKSIAVHQEGILLEKDSQVRSILNALTSNTSSPRLVKSHQKIVSCTTPDLSDLPAPFSQPFWYEKLRDMYCAEVLNALRKTDIFNRSIYERTLHQAQSNPLVESWADGKVALTHDIERAATRRRRFALHGAGNDSFARKTLHVAMTPAHVGSLSVLTHLMNTVTPHWKVDFSFAGITPESALDIIHGQTNVRYNAFVITLGAAASVLSQSRNSDFVPFMIMPQNSYQIMYPANENDTPELNRGEYLIYCKTASTSMLYFDQLQSRGLIKKTKISVSHVDENEVPALFGSAKKDLRTILWFPYDKFNEMFGTCRYFPDERYDCFVNEVMFVHQSVVEDQSFGTAVNFLIRDAWLSLLGNRFLRERIVDQLLTNTAYTSALCRLGGLYNFSDEMFEAAKAKYFVQDESDLAV